MYLYIDDNSFNYLDNTSIYDNPGNFVETIIGQKDPDAVNIFITENANTPGTSTGVTLGFYSPGGDYIIIRNNDVRAGTSSLTHELGHFFALPHPFLGWEGVYQHYGWTQSWDVSFFNGMYNSTTCAGNNQLAELVDQSNCMISADRICDTPPDYNFGLLTSNCVWNNTLKDINGDVIDPQENNIMSYFGDCDEYVFTDGQVSVMHANFNSSARNYIRSEYEPDTTEIISNHELVQPSSNEMLDFYTNVLLNWSDADGASNYLVTINNLSTQEVTEYFVEDSELFLEELMPNTGYFWFVRPFNEGNTIAEEKSDLFFTGSEINTSVKESQLIQNVSVFPNPASQGQNINVSVSMEKSNNVTVSLIDITGRIVVSENQILSQGNNTITLDAIAEAGIYIIKLDTEDGSIHKKIVIR